MDDASNATYALSSAQRETYRRYAGLSLPRHTSYPSVPAWTADYDAITYARDLHLEGEDQNPLSLYVHVPFCQKLCHYCACNKLIVPKDHPKSQTYVTYYLEAFELEMAHVGVALGGRQVLSQLHFGGGTPTYLTPDEIAHLMGVIDRHFVVATEAEISIELDPRVTSKAHLVALRKLGFNRLSLGVQDFDEKVQHAINRIQPYDTVAAFVADCREIGDWQLNFDLIYGLPFQSIDSMRATLEKVVGLAPERIAFYRLALIPEIFKWQRTFTRADMPSGELPLDLNLLAINYFRAAGYDFIGLDHFARPDDMLAKAQRDGTIRRNFQGMTTGGDVSVIGIGPSAISGLSSSYAQNEPDLHKWQKRVQDGLPTTLGIRLTADDKIRRHVLQQIYCARRVDKALFAQATGHPFDAYFTREEPALRELCDQKIIEISKDGFVLTKPLGELLVRVVGAVFDAHLPADAYKSGLAKTSASKVG